MHIQGKKPVGKGYMLCGTNLVTFWKRQNCGDSEKIDSRPGLRGEGVEEAGRGGCLGPRNCCV